MPRIALISLLFLFNTLVGYAQEKVKPIAITGDSLLQPKAIFVGEVHDIYEGWAFKQQMILWAYKRFGIKDVVMEMGTADAYMFNEYVRHGDTTVFDYYGHEPAVMERLGLLEKLHQETDCTFWGVDFEREGYAVVSLALLKKHSATGTALYDFLSGLAIDGIDDRTHRKKHVGDYEQARALFKQEQAQLKQLLSQDYVTMEKMLLNPATEQHMKQRDAGMAQNLAAQLGNKGFICLIGAGHTHFQNKTLAKRYLETHKAEDMLVVTMLCKNCYNTSYYGTEQSALAGDYRNKDAAYFKNVCDEYCKPNVFTLVNQRALRNFPAHYYPVPTYYAVFKDQPKW